MKYFFLVLITIQLMESEKALSKQYSCNFETDGFKSKGFNENKIFFIWKENGSGQDENFKSFGQWEMKNVQ